MDGNIPDTPPVVVIPAERDAARWEELRAQSAAGKAKLRQLRDEAQPGFEAWVANRRLDAQPLDGLPETLSVTSIPAELPNGVTAGEGPDKQVPALHFSEKSTYNLASHPEFQADKPFSIAAWVYLPGVEETITVASQITSTKKGEKADDDDDSTTTSTGWAIEIGGRVPTLRLVSGKSNIRVRGGNVERLQPKAWSHLTFTYDGSRGQNGLALYVNGKTVSNVNDGGDAVELKGDIRNGAPVKLGGKLAGGAIAEFRVYDRALRQEEAQILASWGTLQAAANKSPGDLSSAEREALLVYYLNRQNPDYRQLALSLARHRIRAPRHPPPRCDHACDAGEAGLDADRRTSSSAASTISRATK